MPSRALKVMFRLLRRHPIYALINTIGLAAGLATFILITLFVRQELRFDRFHEHADRIVRVTSHYSDETGTRSFARTYPAIAPALVTDFAEVKAAVRLQRWMAPIRSGDNQFNEQQLFLVDPSFFDVFTFPVIQGDRDHPLDDAHSAVITRSTAARYFGDEDPIGRDLVMADTMRLHVTAVLDDPPPYSHLQFSILLPIQILRDRWAVRGNDLDATWTSGTFYTYLRLANAGARETLGAQMDGFVRRHIGDEDETGVTYGLGLQPLVDIHLKSSLRQELGPNGSMRYVLTFVMIAFLVLLISCVNYVNLATSQAVKRMREVGVKKALGAPRTQIARQFLFEAIAMSLLALCIALVLIDRLLPWFDNLTGSAIPPLTQMPLSYAVGLVGLSVLTGALAGSYPAIVLSSFRPSDALSGGARKSGAMATGNVRRSLLSVQFFLSTSIVACTAVAWQQTRFMRDSELGFKTHIMVLPYYWDASVNARFPTLKSELLRLSGVRSVTASGDVPGRMFTSMSYWIEGMPDQERGGINALIVDPDFAQTYGLQIVAGKDFSIDERATLGESFILNQAAVRELGLTEAEVVGKTFQMNTRGPVIGVVKDFHFEGLQKSLEPLVMTVWPDWFGYVSVAVESKAIGEVVSDVNAVWSSMLPNRPFEYFFLDQDFDRQYRAEDRFGELFGVFASLAIFLSCLGLLGLAAHSTERRTKEIGIRKVFGASVGRIVVLVNREFSLLLFLGAIASIPATWFSMNGWLDTFAYRIELGPLPFIVSISIVAILAVLTVSYHSVRAATADPVESIRYE